MAASSAAPRQARNRARPRWCRGSQTPRHGATQAERRAAARVRDLKVEYLDPRGPSAPSTASRFDSSPGEVFGLAGESGSGKSTVAHAIMRLLHPPAVITGGQVRFHGADVLAMNDEELEQFRWREVSMVFQSAMNALNPVMTDRRPDRRHDPGARRGVARGGARAGGGAARPRRHRRRAARRLPARALRRHAPARGDRHRLALNPPLMIMDEPTTALDVVVQQEILQQIEELKERLGFSILFITHDLSLLVEFSDRIAIMYAGQIVEQAAAQELFEALTCRTGAPGPRQPDREPRAAPAPGAARRPGSGSQRRRQPDREPRA